MTSHPRLTGLATAFPALHFEQGDILNLMLETIIDPHRPEDAALAQDIRQIFAASRVARRHSFMDMPRFYREAPRTTAERMALFAAAAGDLAAAAVARTLAALPAPPTDLIVASCTGYVAPGVDVHLARTFGLPGRLRRVCVGHMGCHGALVALRQALSAVRADPAATALLACVELTTLHFMPTRDLEAITSFALFGDGAASAALTWDPAATGPEVLDVACHAEYAAADQMSWRITDQGFVMGLSPRVPATLRRHVREAVAALLAPHGLDLPDIAHWIIHPGGPSILEAIQRRLELAPDALDAAWTVLRERGNCSSPTVLMVLAEQMRARRPAPGEYGVMMAFGPGLSLESALLRF